MDSTKLYEAIGNTVQSCPIYIDHQGTLYEITGTTYNPEADNWSKNSPLIIITGKKSLVQYGPEQPAPVTREGDVER